MLRVLRRKQHKQASNKFAMCPFDNVKPIKPCGTGSNHTAEKLRFGTLAIQFTPLYQCLSEEALKAVGPFYLVSMPGEVKDPTSSHWNSPPPECDYGAENAAPHLYRKKKNKKKNKKKKRQGP